MLIWHFFHVEIRSGFRWFRWSEMWVLSLFLPHDYEIQWGGYAINFHEWVKDVPRLRPQDLNGDTLTVLSTLAMKPLQLIFVAAMGGMGLYVMLNGPGTEYRRKLNLDGFIRAQAGNFPVISPFVKFNPSKAVKPRPPGSPVPRELPIFAEALGPEEWLVYNRVPIIDGKVDEQAAYIAFAQQLGPRWKGPMKLAPYKQILLACCCLKASRKRKDADDMLGRLAKCWDEEKGLQLSRDSKLHKEALKILKTESLAKVTLSKANQHGFETTAMLRALATAREEGGVMAPSTFVWLRAHDRRLWYPLNNLGRQSYHMEAIGALSHYKVEKLTGRPVPKPRVQGAVESITEFMQSRRARAMPVLMDPVNKTAKKK